MVKKHTFKLSSLIKITTLFTISYIWNRFMPRLKPLTITLLIATAILPSYVLAEHNHTELELEKVTVSGSKLDSILNQSGQLSKDEIDALQSSISDSAKLLEGMPGVSIYGAGGVSGLPAIHGLADDRLRIKIDGMDLISACANHMNPPLSYITPSNIETIALYAGLSPVSMGGDSIGGSVIVESTKPEFAKSKDDVLSKGELGAFYRSNGDARGGNLSATLATEQLSINYNGSHASANNYDAAKSFKPAGLAAVDRGFLDGDEVGSTAYESNNHALNIALHQDNHLLQLKLGYQNIPYQGWPNQRMDMIKNESNQINLSYKGTYGWGNLETNLYKEETRHKMQFGYDKQFLYGVDAEGMPMETEGQNIGFALKTEIIKTERDLIRLGTDIQHYNLDDYWEASGSTGMMQPNTFWNINNGERDRYAVFTEWEANWNPQWMTLAGVRYEHVNMNADDIQSYNDASMAYMADVNAFNNAEHEKTDNNFDITLLAKLIPSNTQTYQFGYAQKTRSPNVYERYSWSTNGMAMRMVNLAGDGNGYVGNLDLEPEIAHTLSATADWHDAAQQNWNVTVTPFISYIDDFIDADRCSSTVMMTGCTAANQTATDAFVYLRYQNHSARLYGLDISGHKAFNTENLGQITASAAINYVRGENRDTGDDLYNIMPLNATFTLEQQLTRWTNVIEWDLVSAKDNTNAERNEIETAGYGLVHLRTSYEIKQARFDLGVENLFDRLYSAPLAGAYVGQGQTMSGTAVPWGVSVPGMGRSLYAGMTYKF